MLKKILLLLLAGLVISGVFIGFKVYNHFKEKERIAAYYENLTDTASPTVTVLRDSILMGYLNEKRTVHIYVPPDYATDSLKLYPVIYLLDGESAFNDLETMGPEWQVDEVINAAYEEGRQTAIVVAINQAEDRDAEYTPFVTEDIPNAHGEQFTSWVVSELKSWVDANYRTRSEAAATTIGGISRSGMMAYYMIMSHPEVFANAIIQSPSMWVDSDRLFSMKLSQEQSKQLKVFVSVGQREGLLMVPDAKKTYKTFRNMGVDDKDAKLYIVPDEGHWHITWRKSFAVAYPWLFGDN